MAACRRRWLSLARGEDGWLAMSRASALRPRRSPVVARLSEAAWPGSASTAMGGKFLLRRPSPSARDSARPPAAQEEAARVGAPCWRHLHTRAEPGLAEDAAPWRAAPTPPRRGEGKRNATPA